MGGWRAGKANEVKRDVNAANVAPEMWRCVDKGRLSLTCC